MVGVKRKRTYGPQRAAKKARTAAKIPRTRFKILSSSYAPSIGQTVRAKLTYSDAFTIDAGIGTAGTYVYSVNGMYDPDITSTGHQPTGFDQMMAIYSEYVVVGSRVRVMARNTGTAGSANNFPGLFGVFLERTTTTNTDFRVYVENGNGVYTHVDSNGDGSDPIKQLTYYADMTKLVGHNIMEDEGYSGTQGANPAEQRYYHIVIAPFDFASNMGAWQFFIEIDFDVVFRDKALTALS